MATQTLQTYLPSSTSVRTELHSVSSLPLLRTCSSLFSFVLVVVYAVHQSQLLFFEIEIERESRVEATTNRSWKSCTLGTSLAPRRSYSLLFCAKHSEF